MPDRKWNCSKGEDCEQVTALINPVNPEAREPRRRAAARVAIIMRYPGSFSAFAQFSQDLLQSTATRLCTTPPLINYVACSAWPGETILHHAAKLTSCSNYALITLVYSALSHRAEIVRRSP